MREPKLAEALRRSPDVTVERRFDPRLGVAMRVGLALTATGIASAGLGRRALSGSGADVPLAVAFGCFVVVVTLFDRHLAVGSSGLAPDDVFGILIAFALPLLAYARWRPPLRDAIATGLVLTTFALVGLACIVAVPYHADAVAALHRSAELFVSGQDPYAVFDLPEALARFRMDPQLATHLDDGTVLHTYNYPALSFLVVAPFVALGLGDVRWVFLAEVLILGLVATSRL